MISVMWDQTSLGIQSFSSSGANTIWVFMLQYIPTMQTFRLTLSSLNCKREEPVLYSKTGFPEDYKRRSVFVQRAGDDGGVHQHPIVPCGFHIVLYINVEIQDPQPLQHCPHKVFLLCTIQCLTVFFFFFRQ